MAGVFHNSFSLHLYIVLLQISRYFSVHIYSIQEKIPCVKGKNSFFHAKNVIFYIFFDFFGKNICNSGKWGYFNIVMITNL